ncbi:MAG: DUF2892 domain-containing protein [Bacteroidia bacterium]|jgi:hypothetical protein
MKVNIHSIDRTIRILVAILFAVLYFTGIITGTIGLVLLILGVVFMLTAVINFCPIYWALGISTRKEQK